MIHCTNLKGTAQDLHQIHWILLDVSQSKVSRLVAGHLNTPADILEALEAAAEPSKLELELFFLQQQLLLQLELVAECSLDVGHNKGRWFVELLSESEDKQIEIFEISQY